MEFKNGPRRRFDRPHNQPPANEPEPDYDLPTTGHWLDEDEEWLDLKEKVKRQAAEDLARNKYHAPNREETRRADPEKVEFNVKFALPKFQFDKFKKRAKFLFAPLLLPLKLIARSSSKQRLAFGTVAICAVAGFFIYSNVLQKDKKEVQGANTSQDLSSGDDIVPSKDIKFDMVLPRGRDIPQDKIFYDAKRNFARYDDEINAVKASISQQPLPETFKDNPDDNVKRIAADFAATEKLSIDNQNMYYGRDENGPQTLILTKKGVLIFINTPKLVEIEALKLYAYNLD